MSGDPLSDIRAVDSAGQLDDVLALPDHLRDALWRIESARLEPADAPAAFVCGMGGSAIGGDLAVSAIGDRLTKPLTTVRGYELPSWTPTDSWVLCSSYSGNTEETLACFEAAEAVGARRLVATTGGDLADLARDAEVPVVGLPAALQPRAAVGYMFCAAAEVARIAGAAPGLHSEIDAAASHLSDRVDALAARSAELAREIGSAVPVVYGSDLTDAVAFRWKCQINENAKRPSFAATLPEADHNELEGWTAPDRGEQRPFACLFLEDSDQHPRERRRIQLTAEAIAPAVETVAVLEGEGPNRTARMLELVMLGDLVSLQLAAAEGIDPSPVPTIETFKQRLGKP